MKRALWISANVALLVLCLGLLNAGADSARANEQASAGEQHHIKIDNFSFAPATLTVPAGTTVTWINRDDIPHTIVSSEGKVLKSPVLDTDQKFSYTFTQPGTYAYFCGIHPKMTGKVIVQ